MFVLFIRLWKGCRNWRKKTNVPTSLCEFYENIVRMQTVCAYTHIMYVTDNAKRLTIFMIRYRYF